MRIEPNSPVPIFRQIADGVRSDVAAGIHRPGDLIPSVRALAGTLLVNPNTVQRAYEQLEREGLIVSKKGVGMVVSPDSKAAARDGVHESIRDAFAQAIRVGQSAGLSRTAVEKLYRDAWNAATPGRST
jgi:GntR family transcriptional regulator